MAPSYSLKINLSYFLQFVPYFWLSLLVFDLNLFCVVGQRFDSCRTRQGRLGLCRQPSACVGISLKEIEDNACALTGGGLGSCCEDFTTNNRVNFEPEAPVRVSLPPISFNEANSFIKGIGPRRSVAKRGKDGSSVRFPEPEDFHQKFNAPRKISSQINEDATFFLDVTKSFQTAKNLTSRQAGVGLRNTFNSQTNNEIRRRCTWDPPPICNQGEKYRTEDGTCNNLKNPNYGRTGTPFQRILVPEYSEGTIDLPRKRGDNRELPAARDVSNKLAGGFNRRDHDNTVLLMQMGQFIDHDLTHTPSFSNRKCCSGNSFPSRYNSDECFPIPIKRNDPFWKGLKTCMEFTRSLKAPGLNCELGNREQPNQITHWLDGSNIYGSTREEAELLRADRGKLKVSSQRGSRHGYLPTCAGKPKGRLEGCDLCEDNNNKGRKKDSCFYAGDFRVNEQLNLIVMHTLFLREHNRVAEQLADMNPCWSDKKLYQEARRITVAQYQHIVYKEWLPIVIGNNFMRVYGLRPLSSGYSFDYADNFDPRINNEFATAAFRFGHSLIPDTFQRVGTNEIVGSSNNPRSMKLKDIFFKPEALKAPGTLDSLLHGMMKQQSQAADDVFSEDVRNHLFESKEGAGGLDLVALNIQRGRDHGLPGYNKYREQCGLGRAARWSDLRATMLPDSVDRLRQVYQSIEDIDLFVGGFLEQPHEDSLVGPVFKCIIGDQFTRLKKGDRFFYDLGTDSNLRFTPPQLDEIRKTSLSRLVCDNTDSVERIQAFAFKMANSRANSASACSSAAISPVNLEVFRDSSCPRPQRPALSALQRPVAQTLVCSTVAGPDTSSGCVLPFRYKNIFFFGCTDLDDPDGRPWCSTRTDASGNHIGKKGHWGHCHKQCPVDTGGLQ